MGPPPAPSGRRRRILNSDPYGTYKFIYLGSISLMFDYKLERTRFESSSSGDRLHAPPAPHMPPSSLVAERAGTQCLMSQA